MFVKIFVLGDIVNDYFLVFLVIDLFIVKIYIKEYLFGGFYCRWVYNWGS